MMILLADQEIEDGRQDQAETLIDAASRPTISML
jgi:hypothetical protein